MLHNKAGMKYQSTRGGVKGLSFSEVVLSSYAPDAGLYVPEKLPQITREQMRSWAGLGYQQLLEKVLSLFVTPEELSPREIHGEQCTRVLGGLSGHCTSRRTSGPC